MNQPKVSIIVPIYNVEKYLDRCMDSLLNQTLSDIEIIMVEDESPDNCPQMCDEYAKKDNRIKVIHKKNEGLGLARNSGLEIATGEYVAFVDSDDFVDRKMYQTLYNRAWSENLDIIYCGFSIYKNDECIIPKSEVAEYTQYNGDGCQDVLQGMVSNLGDKRKIVRYEMSVWHALYKLDTIKNNNVLFCSERKFISEDIVFHVDIIVKCSSIAFVPNCYYYYCLNNDSLSKLYRIDRIPQIDILSHELIRRIKANHYHFCSKKAINVVLLELRHVLSMLVTYGFSKSEITDKIKDMVNRKEFQYWIRQTYWQDLPIRYIVFVLAAKYKMTRLLSYMISR